MTLVPILRDSAAAVERAGALALLRVCGDLGLLTGSAGFGALAAAAGSDARTLEERADRMTRGSADNLERFRAATERVTGRGGSG